MNTWIPVLSFAVFLVMFLGVGGLAAKRSKPTETDYLLGSRSFGKVFVGLSAGATGNSGWIMIGAVGMAYTMGFPAFLLLIACFLGELTFWTLLPDKINRISVERNSQTIAELLGSAGETPHGVRVITLLAALITLIFVGAYTAAQFAAAAKTLNVFFGLAPALGVLLAAGAILAYCVSGGLRASIWTDVVQALVVILVSFGMPTVAIFAGGGVAEILLSLEQIDPELLDITAGFTTWTLLAYLFGFFVWGFGFDISQPHVLVRLLAGRSPEEVKQARYIYLGYVYSTWAAMLLFGIACRALMPDISDPEQALPLFARQHLNPWFTGVVLAGVFSIIASTADSQILVCSSTLSRDISPDLHHKMVSKYGVRYDQAMTLLFGIFAVIITINIDATVFSSVLLAVGALVSSLGPVMLIVILKRRTHYLALCSTMIAGLVTALGWRILGYDTLVNETLPGFLIALTVHELIATGTTIPLPLWKKEN